MAVYDIFCILGFSRVRVSFRVMPFGLISESKVDEVVPHFTALPFHSPCHKRI